MDGQSDISLSQVWQILGAGKRYLIGWLLVGTVVSIAVVVLVPERWEATALVRLGRVGAVHDTAGVHPSEEALLIESPERASERFRMRSFQDNVLSALAISIEDSDARSDLYRTSLKARPVRGTDLLELKVRGFSAQDAEALASGSVMHLREVHRTIEVPLADRLNAQVEETGRELVQAESERSRLSALLVEREGAAKKAGFAESVYLANLIAQDDEKIRKLRDRLILLQEQSSPSRTYPTGLLDTISVPPDPVFPRRVLVIVLAVGGGLMLGLFGAFLAGTKVQ
jgi:uncharacterized protein involved in exopolysaccharide biosynthesis